MEQDYERIEKAIAFAAGNFRAQPDLARMAAAADLSESHFQRLFRRWAGVSPKRFVQYLTAEHARGLLEESRTSVLDAAYDAGLSGPGRLHDLTVAIHAMTPGELRHGGEGLTIRHGSHDSPFGRCHIAMTERGVCALSFDESPAPRWPKANHIDDHAATAPVVRRIFRGDRDLALHVSGTNFQIRVWEALLKIPRGLRVTYGDVARSIGAPTSARAVGAAVGANPVGYLIPCHRVILQTGAVRGYRWGTTRKLAMLGRESAGQGFRNPPAPRRGDDRGVE